MQCECACYQPPIFLADDLCCCGHCKHKGESLLPLCTSHCQLVYRLSNPEKLQCKICGIKCKHARKASDKHFLPCPESQMVELFLKETVQFNGCLRVIWFVFCYKYLVARLINSDPCTLSNEEVVMQLKQKLKCSEETISNFNEEDEHSLVVLALLKTAMHLCKVLASDNTVPFSDIYSCLLSFLPNSLNCDISVSKSRVLTFIGNEFGDHLSSVCQNKRDGGIFFRNQTLLIYCHMLSTKAHSIVAHVQVKT